MKSNSQSTTRDNRLRAARPVLSPALLAGLLTVALPFAASAQARQARSGYAPSPGYQYGGQSGSSRPASSMPSYSRPDVSGGMRTAPTVTPRSSLPNSPNFSGSLNSRTGTPTLLFQNGGQNGSSSQNNQNRQNGQNGQTNPPPRVSPPVTQINPNSRTVIPGTRITQTNPGTINNLITRSGASYNRFNNSVEARRYRFGVPNRGRYFYGGYNNFSYFPGDLAFYPYYSPYYSFGYTTLSPYAFYYGAFPPFITLGGVYSAPPQYGYVPYPVYNNNGGYSGYRQDDVDGYYLNRNNAGDGGYRVGEGTNNPNRDRIKDAALDAAIADIREAWKSGKSDNLAKHVRRDARVAVYLRGKYQYSLDAGDYLDMTKDAIAATKTTRFELDNIQRKQKDVYTVTGRHVYRDADGNDHSVFVTYVLEKADDAYVITQVGSAPERVEE